MRSTKQKPDLPHRMVSIAADLYRLAGTHIAAPAPSMIVAAGGDQVKVGVFLAAQALRDLLERDAECSAALRDFVRKPSFEDARSE